MIRPAIIALALAVCAGAARAQTPTRPLSTDRPDRTESAYSVPAGWLQIETDLVSQGRVAGDDATVTGTSICALNVKYGVARRVDLQLLFTPWIHLHTEPTGLPAHDDDGTGQAGVRMKLNLAGNDQGGGAFAILPFAVVPTRGGGIFDSVTWGLLAPASIDLGDDRAISTMAGFMRLDNEDTWFIGSMSLASPIAGAVAGFVEVFVARAGFEQDALDDVTVDLGLTVAPSPDWQLDAGIYRGITDTSEDWRVFAGASARFSLLPQ